MRSLVLLVPFLLAIGPFSSPKDLVDEGNRLFTEDKYDEAIEKYDLAAEGTEKDAPIVYNKGNAQLMKGDLEAALRSYREGAAYGDDALRAKSFYNMGNALYNTGNYAEAAQAYKDALRHDPKDEDAKINLEMALKMMEEQQQQDKQENKGDDKGSDSGEKKEGGKNEEEKDNPESSPGKKRDEKEEKTPASDQKMKKKNEKEMSREEANRLLESLGDQNMDLQSMSDMVQDANPVKVEKDW